MVVIGTIMVAEGKEKLFKRHVKFLINRTS